MTLYTDDNWLESKEFPFFTAEYHFYRGELIPAHSHEFIEFIYVVEGTGVHEYRGQSYNISEGDVFIIEPYVSHSYQANTDQLFVHNVIFQPSMLEKELSVLSQFTSFIGFFYIEPFFRNHANFQTHLKLGQHEHIEIMIQLDRLLQEFTKKEMGYNVVIKSRLIELFVYLSRCYSKREQQQWPPIQDESTLFQDISNFIQSHYSQPLSLEQVSHLCRMSQSSFSVKFKQHFNKTFVEYRNGIRIQVAKGLLMKTNQKISSVAEQIGFEDLSYFNKLFKREVGTSPIKYRQQSQHEINSN